MKQSNPHQRAIRYILPLGCSLCTLLLFLYSHQRHSFDVVRTLSPSNSFSFLSHCWSLRLPVFPAVGKALLFSFFHPSIGPRRGHSLLPTGLFLGFRQELLEHHLCSLLHLLRQSAGFLRLIHPVFCPLLIFCDECLQALESFVLFEYMLVHLLLQHMHLFPCLLLRNLLECSRWFGHCLPLFSFYLHV